MDLQIDSEVACISEKKTAIFWIMVLEMIKGLFFQSNCDVFHCSGAWFSINQNEQYQRKV